MLKKLFITLGIFIFVANICLAEELLKPQSKYPDYGYLYLGTDKYEKLNRKIFAFNLGLNKYAIRPIHILWSSIMPEYGIDRIHSAYKNIEYPKRLVSSLIQKDFKTSGTETVRFLTNTTLGLGGMFDPAKHFFKLEPSNEDMEQALTKCKCCSGSYIVLPVMNGTTARGIAGKLLDTSLNPTTYVGTPVLAMVKAGLTVNRTSFMQPLIKMIESTYADPYDIARKMYGIDNFIKCENLDKKEVLENGFKQATPQYPADINPELVKMDLRGIDEKSPDELTVAEIIKGGTNIDNIILKSYNATNSKLMADILLHDYNPQNPVVDSMRTALFDNPDVDKSVWNELSIWNRSFGKKIHTSSVNIVPERPNYKFKYIMQKDKTSPVAIIYPSIGEGVSSHHSVVLAKLFYDEGYSVIIQGSHFQWEFAKSMPEGYAPGIPTRDVKYLKEVTGKIIDNLEKKYDCKLGDKTFIGTSFGAVTTLFLADSEAKDNTFGKAKFISICPPVELVYAMEQVDKNGEEWRLNVDNLKHKIAETASKVVQLSDLKDSSQSQNFELNKLPFSEEEGKLITGFIMHQKLSDLVFTLENTPKNKQTAIYDTINNMNYKDYAVKYLLKNNFDNLAELNRETSLLSLEDYLKNNSNYKIYHSLDDYLTNHAQLKKLKLCTGKKTVLMSNGAHLGFLYTKEFLDNLKDEIKLSHES